MVESVDTRGLKLRGGNPVRVRVPPPARPAGVARVVGHRNPFLRPHAVAVVPYGDPVGIRVALAGSLMCEWLHRARVLWQRRWCGVVEERSARIAYHDFDPHLGESEGEPS